MTIDKPSLAAMLAQSRRKEAMGIEEDEQVSKRPFMLKDPKHIVKEILKKEAPPKEESDDDYIQSLLKEEPTDEEAPVEFQLDLPLEDEPLTSDEILKKIMGKR